MDQTSSLIAIPALSFSFLIGVKRFSIFDHHRSFALATYIPALVQDPPII